MKQYEWHTQDTQTSQFPPWISRHASSAPDSCYATCDVMKPETPRLHGDMEITAGSFFWNVESLWSEDVRIVRI